MRRKNAGHSIVWVVLLLVVAGAASGLLLWRNGPKTQPDISPPVYGPPESDFFIDRPLYLSSVSGGELTTAQRQHIGEYRKKILARVVSNVPLRDDEKRFIASSIATTTVPSFLEGVVFLNQTMFQFAPDELGLISATLGR